MKALEAWRTDLHSLLFNSSASYLSQLCDLQRQHCVLYVLRDKSSLENQTEIQTLTQRWWREPNFDTKMVERAKL